MLKKYFKHIHEDLVIDPEVIKKISLKYIRQSIKRNEDVNFSNDIEIDDSELLEMKLKVEG
jgi:hypothetical protein